MDPCLNINFGRVLRVHTGVKSWPKLCPMVIILDDNSFHVVHA